MLWLIELAGNFLISEHFILHLYQPLRWNFSLVEPHREDRLPFFWLLDFRKQIHESEIIWTETPYRSIQIWCYNLLCAICPEEVSTWEPSQVRELKTIFCRVSFEPDPQPLAKGNATTDWWRNKEVARTKSRAQKNTSTL